MDYQGKDNRDPQRPPKRIGPHQLQTHNVPTNDMENTNDTNLGGDLQFAKKPRTVPRETMKRKRDWN